MSAVLKESTDTRQLQFWNATRKVYEHRMDAEDIPFNNVRSYANGRPWRICKPERSVKNPRHNPPRHTASAYTVADMQSRYCTWAQSRGLKSITIFDRKPVCLGNFNGEIRRVDADAYFAVTEETES